MTISTRSPANVAQMFQQALALHRQGQLREAEKAYARVVKIAPDYFDALNLLGTVKAQLGEAGEAGRLFHAAIKINPRAPDAWINLGLAQHALKRDADALESFDKALALKPDDLDAQQHRGNALMSLARPHEALEAFERVLALEPRHIEARVNRGAALAQLGRHNEAIADFDAALAANARNPVAHYNRGIALFSLGRAADAVAAYDAAVALAPSHARAWNDRGRALAALNRHDEAVASYGNAIELDKDYADAHFNAALALLTVGDLGGGFAQYEWRWRRTGMPAQRKYSRPLWLGDTPLAGKTIVLHAEQGLGDAIQFARYVPLLARSGAKVVLETPPELQGLFAPLEGVAAIAARGAALPAFDRHCPLGSLPLAFRTEPGTIPADIPYLKADDAHLAKWRPRIEALGRPRVALAWSGNASHVNDRNRSIAFAALAPLLAVEGAGFISIQRDVRAADAEFLSRAVQVTPLGEELADFADTAAVLALADLVVCVDTAVAHLAGAMGRPVWILLPFSPDWRWALTGETSRWYPTARLFRQPSLGDWASVVEHVAAELTAFIRAAH